jgi:hypothetical protein
MQKLPVVLEVRHSKNRRIDLVKTEAIHSVRLKENLTKDPIHTTYSEVVIECRDLNFTYSQFHEPECFDFVCGIFGIETQLKRDARIEFTQLREDSVRKQTGKFGKVIEDSRLGDLIRFFHEAPG